MKSAMVRTQLKNDACRAKLSQILTGAKTVKLSNQDKPRKEM